MLNGSITLSFDCEGKWGMTDLETPWDQSLTGSALLSVYEFILRTLDEYDLPSTFAFVGAFTEHRDQFFKVAYPNLNSPGYDRWLQRSRYRIEDESEEGWFLPELLDMVKDRAGHEIASHGYTHVPFDYLTDDEVNVELKMVRDWAVRRGLDCSTFVYPRNIVRYHSKLPSFDIFGYRSVPAFQLDKCAPKFLRVLAEELCVIQRSEKLPNTYPACIPGGAFINWRRGFRRVVPSSFSMLKYKSMIKNAAHYGEVAHFWLHPHNLITSPETKELFSGLCKQIAKCRDNMPVDVKRQKDYVASTVREGKQTRF